MKFYSRQFLEEKDLNELSLSVWDAAQILDYDLGSGQDPIYREKKETTPIDLSYTDLANEPATKIKISYHSIGEKGLKLVHGGTLIGMIKNRLKPWKEKLPRHKHKYNICSCGAKK